MGKGVIISGGEDGQYQVQLKLNKGRIEALIVALTKQIAIFETKIEAMEDGPAKEVAILIKTAMEKRKEFLEGADVPNDPIISAWCADLTEDLAGDVGTIEIPGERKAVNIQPGYNGNATFNQPRDGQLEPAIAGTPAGVFYNLAMLPGWQKWRPSYRFGTITSINGDTCTVSLESAHSSQQNLDVNQSSALYNVPIEYMTCNGAAFSEGDGVIIEFEDRDWNKPKVIGFDAEPKPCSKKCSLMEDTDLGPELAGSLISTVTNCPDKEGVEMDIDAEWLGSILSLDGSINAQCVWPELFYLPLTIHAWAQVQLSLPAESFTPGWYHIEYEYNVPIPALNTESDITLSTLGGYNTFSTHILCGLESADVAGDEQPPLKLRNYGNGSLWEWVESPGGEAVFNGYLNITCGAAFSGNYTACVELTSPEDIITFRIKALCHAHRLHSAYGFNFSFSFNDVKLSLTSLSVKKINLDVENDGPWVSHDCDESLLVNPPISPAMIAVF